MSECLNNFNDLFAFVANYQLTFSCWFLSN